MNQIEWNFIVYNLNNIKKCRPKNIGIVEEISKLWISLPSPEQRNEEDDNDQEPDPKPKKDKKRRLKKNQHCLMTSGTPLRKLLKNKQLIC